jgi:FkbM family methyltransferase
MNIVEMEEDGEFKKLRFNDLHESWFPSSAKINEELWNEYLSVFWQHPINAHHYFADDVKINVGDICIDCGCCEGFFVFQALESGAGKVICIEPNPHMSRCLEKTFSDEVKSGRVIIRQVALGAFRGRTSFSFDATFPSFGKIDECDNIEGLPVVIDTLAAICAELGVAKVDFIKMDIEGAEIQAIEGAIPLLAKHRPKLAITTYHRAFDFRCLEAILSSLDYRHIKAAGITKFGGSQSRPILLHSSR